MTTKAQKYACKQWGRYGRLQAQHGYEAAHQNQAQCGLLEHISLRGLERLLGILRHTLRHWLTEWLPQLPPCQHRWDVTKTPEKMSGERRVEALQRSRNSIDHW
jgi:hypothetical protein